MLCFTSCLPVSASCLDAMDCADIDERCREEWHCVDGQCACGHGYGGELPGEGGEPGEGPGEGIGEGPGGAGGPGK